MSIATSDDNLAKAIEDAISLTYDISAYHKLIEFNRCVIDKKAKWSSMRERLLLLYKKILLI